MPLTKKPSLFLSDAPASGVGLQLFDEKDQEQNLVALSI